MKKMTEVLVHLSGNLPRSEELFGVLRRYGRRKATWEEIRSAALAETSEWIRLERELGFDLLTEPRSFRHMLGLKVRGQRTRTTGRKRGGLKHNHRMGQVIDDETGSMLVRLARRSIELALEGEDPESLLKEVKRAGLRRGSS